MPKPIYKRAGVLANWRLWLSRLSRTFSIADLSLELFPRSNSNYLYKLLSRVVGKEFLDVYNALPFIRPDLKLQANWRELLTRLTPTFSLSQLSLELYPESKSTRLYDELVRWVGKPFIDYYATLKDLRYQQSENARRSTIRERYGVDSIFQSSLFKEKSTATMLARYGVKHIMQVPSFVAKRKLTYWERYRLTSPFGNPKVYEKGRKKRLANRWFSVFNVSSIEELYDWRKCLGSDFVNFKETLYGAGIRLFGSPERSRSMYQAWERFWGNDPEYLAHLDDPRYQDLVGKYFFTSKLEEEINAVYGSVKLYPGQYKEIDCYFEDRKIGFELNGYRIHTSYYTPLKKEAKTGNYHQFKTNYALNDTDHRCKLYHIWYIGADYPGDRERVLSIVKTRLGIYEQSYSASRLIFTYPERSVVMDFYARNHEIGSPSNNIFWSAALADRDTGDIIMAMSFARSGKISDVTVNNVRLCTKRNCKVDGGFNRLMSHSISELKHRGYKRLITYCDRDLSPVAEDTVYQRYGFTYLGDAGPSLFYYDDRHQRVINREHYMKYKLEELFPETWESFRHEQEMLAMNKIYPCYTSGLFKFSLDIS